MWRVKRRFKVGRRVYEAGEEVDLPPEVAEKAEAKGLIQRVQVQVEEIPAVEPPKPAELLVVTSDVAKETGLRRMRARVLRVELTTGLRGTEQVHLVLRPLDREWSDIHEWFGISKSKGSAYVALCDKLVRLGAVDRGGNLVDIQGKAFEWEEKEGVGRSQRPKWFPVKLVQE
jgi:hypothetical protein